MVTALYRRYRPETFSEMIGQSQVTDPLRTALRTDRVNHAYLFSGPRGCGKTTSARILARCLNCAEGPTDTPCGTCPSCVELSRDGGGSLDVVEIDAASHNGVDDARDLRERAVFAPARDRYKIFILDEAHMVTPQGFNALLKIVEEPPPHIKFIFATTEPDKVIGTIRSRTHHYPFRLVPPAQMLEYTQRLCDEEGVQVEPGVLPLVVRAGGGSPRDTLSLLDQLMAGSDGTTVGYERAVALLGYTHSALLDEVVGAIGRADAKGAFESVDRVVQTGQDPRRFVDDLLERLRDLIVVDAAQGNAGTVLRGLPEDELERMIAQAALFGQAELSRTADIANTALTDMTGATSPKLHLELMIARMLVPSVDETERGALARVERLERRAGMPTDADAQPPAATPIASQQTAPAAAPRQPEPQRPAAAEAPPVQKVSKPAPVTRPKPTGPVTLQMLRDSWPEVLEHVAKAKRSTWMLVMNADVRDLKEDILTLVFPSPKDLESFKKLAGGDGPSEHLRSAIVDVLGLRVKYIAKVDGAPDPGASAAAPVSPAQAAPREPRASSTSDSPPAEPEEPAPTAPSGAVGQSEWAPADDEPPFDPYEDAAPPDEPVPAPAQAAPVASEPAREPAAEPNAPVTGWSVVQIPSDDDADDAPSQVSEQRAATAPAPVAQPAQAASSQAEQQKPQPVQQKPGQVEAPGPDAAEQPVAQQQPQQQTQQQRSGRYGEAVVREVLRARFIEEQENTTQQRFN
ncbi:DNA polymerase III subunit gamma and tau [Paramicrobacterium chengjingii]|uniref:DNA polymerase III subunit gamma/tau n=1 Tax=Paramicrobacterium chengjingii TaxID=2769067 RepID=A0ABX6YFD4_9MICO|nr:DNA polymerase III subunit gamma and tau [Microbacterium chengjingii]QPZ37507.1 DNA polymerase III subunit gamma and tau [Microbacterium chengjingii]